MKPSRRDLSYSLKAVFFTWPRRRREEQVLVRVEARVVDDRLDLLVGLERDEVDDGRSPRRALLHRDLVRAQPIDLAAVGEQQQVRERRRVHDLARRGPPPSARVPCTPRPPRDCVRKASAATALM